MQSVTSAWKDVNQRFLLPETFVEISSRVPSVDYSASVSATNEASFSVTRQITNENSASIRRNATMERNLWVLDGSCGILPSTGTNNRGYVSADDSGSSITVKLPSAMEAVFPGITVAWSEEFEEYPTSFSVVAKNGDAVVASTTVTNNRENKTLVSLEMSGFDSVTIEPIEWCLPRRRVRVDKVVLGHEITFNKGDIISYQHSHSGDILCGELPKNMIQFSVLNVDGRWNPSNPTGLWRYLSERQKLTARYGLNVDGVIQWIPAGVFYLSDWYAPSNGLEASFEARDLFEYLLTQPYTGRATGAPMDMVKDALGDLSVSVNYTPDMWTAKGTLTSEYTAAEVIQMCANASLSSVYQTRTGALQFTNWRTYAVSDYVIGKALSYSHPEITLSKPIKGIAVTYEKETPPYEMTIGTSGEVQTVENELIGNIDNAVYVADWVKTVLESRKTISGEFRADPRLDLYDIVTVESKYGDILPVVITNIAYSYSGSFKASYTGRVIGLGVSA